MNSDAVSFTLTHPILAAKLALAGVVQEVSYGVCAVSERFY
jgi:hypothetical protein